MSLTVQREAIRAGLGYLDEKEFAQAKNADPREFFDNSFVDNLERSGFLQKSALGNRIEVLEENVR